MYRYFFVFSLFIASCTTTPSGGEDSSAISVVDSMHRPDISFLRERLFKFLESHKQLDSFDTVDYTFQEYGGRTGFVPYYVEAGHLLSEEQVHATVYYVDDQGQGLYMYLRNDTGWLNIFIDTTFEYTGPRCFPYYEDWNADGIKDLILRQDPHMGSIYKYKLWLTDKSGRSFHYVDLFETVEEVKPDTITGEITFKFYHAGNLRYDKYKFVDYKLNDISSFAVLCSGVVGSDSECMVGYSNGKRTKEFRTSAKNAHKYAPAEWKKDVREVYE